MKTKLIAGVLVVVLTGCGLVSPKPYTEQEVEERVAKDRLSMYADQEPISKPLSFYEAAARALKYNLEYRLKLMEAALSDGLMDMASWDMMPRLLAGAGYTVRNNTPGTTTSGITSDRARNFANIEFSWNLLDFGVSYMRANQKADQFLMAEERKRKVAQNVLQDVRSAYWRALGAQRLTERVELLMRRVTVALDKSRQTERLGLLPQPVTLAYQRALLDAVGTLGARRQELELAKGELAALLSIPPGTQFTLADDDAQELPLVPRDPEYLELMALKMRPDVMEEWYRKRVSAVDIKAAMMQALPSVDLTFFNWQYDSNRYLYNHTWADSGVRFSWNLMRLASLPTLSKALDLQHQVDDYRRMALSMAVLTQVRIALQRYTLARDDLELARVSSEVDTRLLNYSRAATMAKMDSELELIRAESRQLLSEYQRYAAFANAQAAWGRLYNSLGFDVLPKEVEKRDVAGLAEAIERTMKHWQHVSLNPPEGYQPPEPIRLNGGKEAAAPAANKAEATVMPVEPPAPIPVAPLSTPVPEAAVEPALAPADPVWPPPKQVPVAADAIPPVTQQEIDAIAPSPDTMTLPR